MRENGAGEQSIQGERGSAGARPDIGDKSATASSGGIAITKTGPGDVKVEVHMGPSPPPPQPPPTGDLPPPDTLAHRVLSRRALAAAIDLAIVLFLSILAGPTVFSALLRWFPALLQPARFLAWLVPGRFPYDYNLVLVLSLFNFLLVSLSYGVLFLWLWQGRTPGKRMAHLRVVDSEGKPPGLAPVVWREFLRHLFLLFLGLGYWYVFLNGQRHALHDVLSATSVSADPVPPSAARELPPEVGAH